MYIKYVDEQGNESLQEMNISAKKSRIYGKDGVDYYEVYNCNFPLAVELYKVGASVSEDYDEGGGNVYMDGIESTQISFNENCGLLPDDKDAFMSALIEAIDSGVKVFDVSRWSQDYFKTNEVDKGV